jgi:hypothetical protein
MQITPEELLELIKLHDEKNLLAKVEPQHMQQCCEGAAKALENIHEPQRGM